MRQLSRTNKVTRSDFAGGLNTNRSKDSKLISVPVAFARAWQACQNVAPSSVKVTRPGGFSRTILLLRNGGRTLKGRNRSSMAREREASFSVTETNRFGLRTRYSGSVS